MLNKSEGTIKRQSKNMGNIAYTRHRTKSNKARTWATLRIQDTGRSLTKQEHGQHYVYKTQDEV